MLLRMSTIDECWHIDYIYNVYKHLLTNVDIYINNLCIIYILVNVGNADIIECTIILSRVVAIISL